MEVVVRDPKFKLTFRLLAAFFICSHFAGCILMPLMEPVRRAGLSSTSRRGLLNERVQLFHNLIAQRKTEDALTLAEPQNRDIIRAIIDELGDEYSITGAEIKKRTDDDSSSNSVLSVDLQRYKVGKNTIENIRLIERWDFSHTDGWLLESLERQETHESGARR